MQNRERGAAHINIYFFLVLLVLFLGTLWFGYINMSEVNGARQDAAKADVARINAEVKTMMCEHLLEEITAVVGEAGDWNGRENFDYENRLKSKWEALFGTDGVQTIHAPKKLAGYSDPALVKDKLENLAKSLGIGATQATPIAPFLGQIKIKYDDALKAEATAEAATKVAKTQSATLSNAFRATDAALTQKLAQANRDYTKNMNDLRNANAGLDTRITSAQAEVRKANTKMDEMQNAHQVVVKDLQKKAQRDAGQMEAWRALNSMRRPPQQADAEVISASMRASRGWVNIGRKDMLLRGTKFKITNPDGTKLKGYGEVITTKQDRAELRIYGVVDRVGNPITKGDHIYNDIYSPNMKRSVAMIGRFSYPYTKPMIRKILEQLGNTVHDDVSVGVDMVIVGLQEPTETGDALKPVEETPGYKKAQVLHCEIVTISKIRDLLQLGDN